MRERLQTDIDGEPTGYTFFFQIANNGGRQACRIKLEASNLQEARTRFRQHWPIIEFMVRNGIKSKAVDESVVTVVMP